MEQPVVHVRDVYSLHRTARRQRRRTFGALQKEQWLREKLQQKGSLFGHKEANFLLLQDDRASKNLARLIMFTAGPCLLQVPFAVYLVVHEVVDVE